VNKSKVSPLLLNTTLFYLCGIIQHFQQLLVAKHIF